MCPEVLNNPSPASVDAFGRWFGPSRVVDEAGRPRVVYHGTRAAFDAFQPGSWFAEDVRMATVFVGGTRRSDARVKEGSALLPVYLAIRNPLDLTDLKPQYHFRLSDFLTRIGVQPGGFDGVLERMEESALAWWRDIQADPVSRELWKSGHRMPGRRGCSVHPRELSDCLRDEAPLWRHLDSPELVAVLRDLGFDGVKMRETVTFNPRLAEGQRYSAKLDEEVASMTWMAFDPGQVKSATANSGAYVAQDARMVFKREVVETAPVDDEEEEEEEEERCAPRF